MTDSDLDNKCSFPLKTLRVLHVYIVTIISIKTENRKVAEFSNKTLAHRTKAVGYLESPVHSYLVTST